MDGITLTPLKQILHPKGDIYHAMKKSDDSFFGFGEAYFSTIKFGVIKAWKYHKRMTMNLVVPEGTIRFVMYDERKDSSTKGMFQDESLSRSNYCRLTVPPKVWLGFQGMSPEIAILLNIASIPHDPKEIVNKDIDKIPFNWD